MISILAVLADRKLLGASPVFAYRSTWRPWPAWPAPSTQVVPENSLTDARVSHREVGASRAKRKHR